MLTKTIEHLEAEKVDGGCEVTVFYKHYYQKHPETLEAKLFIEQNENGHFTDTFREAEVILGVHVPELTVDWKPMKELPEGHPASKLDEDNPMRVMAISNAPGRMFWKAEGYKP